MFIADVQDLIDDNLVEEDGSGNSESEHSVSDEDGVVSNSRKRKKSKIHLTLVQCS